MRRDFTKKLDIQVNNNFGSIMSFDLNYFPQMPLHTGTIQQKNSLQTGRNLTIYSPPKTTTHSCYGKPCNQWWICTTHNQFIEVAFSLKKFGLIISTCLAIDWLGGFLETYTASQINFILLSPIIDSCLQIVIATQQLFCFWHITAKMN